MWSHHKRKRQRRRKMFISPRTVALWNLHLPTYVIIVSQYLPHGLGLARAYYPWNKWISKCNEWATERYLSSVGHKPNGSSFPAGTALAPISLDYHLGPLGLAFALNCTLKCPWLQPQRPGHTTGLSSSSANSGGWLSQSFIQHQSVTHLRGVGGRWEGMICDGWNGKVKEHDWQTSVLLPSSPFSCAQVPSAFWIFLLGLEHLDSQSKTKENTALSYSQIYRVSVARSPWDRSPDDFSPHPGEPPGGSPGWQGPSWSLELPEGSDGLLVVQSVL